MGLSRLDNFLKSVRGNTLYVDPNSLDSTDSVENQGNSPTRPFKTIQRALIEAARFSYQVGNNNDRFNKTTIILQPGDHIVDNRPGVIIKDDGNYLTRGGLDNYGDFAPFDLLTNFDLASGNNALYKLNSVYGGIIIPRGTSIVGMDLRKTKIRPKFVPNPENDDIDRSAIFRLTGACFLYGFTILDSDPNANCFKDYTLSQFVPNFSHHKLTAFEYADGVNGIKFDDIDFETTRTDLDMYYEKVGVAYGDDSGRKISPDYPDEVDIQPVIDEYRIVGSKGKQVAISNISCLGSIVTVTLEEELFELSANSPIQISGVVSNEPADIYNGQYVISSVISPSQFTYRTTVQNIDTTPNTSGAFLNFTVDTVTSASPYVFNVSLRSVYGMCGMHADGSKADGFKSMVVAQFTGIGLQKDDNAFVRYNSLTRQYQTSPTVTDIHTNSLARFKPNYQNYHIKASNNAFIQLVSIFAIGYAEHFVVESGGDQSITNSNSNFGAKSLVSRGFRDETFPKDDLGYITHIVSPQAISEQESSVEFIAVDVGLTTSVSSGAGSTTRLYLYEKDNRDNPPDFTFDGYRIGARQNDLLYCQISQSGITSTYSCRITMPGSDLTSEKSYSVLRIGNDTQNSISSSGTITLTSNHEFISGEKVRVYSNNGNLPDGLSSNSIYYVSTIGLQPNEIRLTTTLSDAISGLEGSQIFPNTRGGKLKIVSKVSDKISGDVGHPIQFDSNNGNWYINVSSTNNTLYNIINSVGINGLGEATPRTYFKRVNYSRNLTDTIYKFRYVIPKDSVIEARPPLDGYIIQDSSTTTLTSSELDRYYSFDNSPKTLQNSNSLRNPGFISNAEWQSNEVTIHTEIPHNLSVGSQVKIENVTSGLNTTTNPQKGFNGLFEVTSIISSKQFKYTLENNPGNFLNDTTARNSSLPTYTQKRFPTTYQIYRSVEIQPYIKNRQDGIYQLFVINCSNKPTIAPFQDLSFSQPVQNLYPQLNRDNPSSDPVSSKSFALPNPIGQVAINNPEFSITKETVEKSSNDLKIGFDVTSIVSSSGVAHTIYTQVEHGLSAITSISIVSTGSNYIGPSEYFAANLTGSSTGIGANARIQINSLGTLNNIVIMDPGSNYEVGDTLSVIPAAGIGTTSGFIPAIIRVDSVTDNVGDTIEISGIDESYSGYNTLYKIVGLTDSANEIIVSSASSVSGFSTTILDLGHNSASYTGKILNVNGVTYNHTSGVGIVTFTSYHDLNVGDRILFNGFNNNFFNKTVSVIRKRSLLSIDVDFGTNDTSLSVSGSIEAYIRGYSSRFGNLTKEEEISSNRNVVQYGGIQSNITSQLTSDFSEPDELVISNAYVTGFRLGDYIQVDEEIFRIKKTVSSSTDTVEVFRSILGSPRQTHDINSVVKKIKVKPVEFRRNSIIRASGHTFEYLGFGPGNYSTAFPERQDRILSSQEELISQASKEDGGIVIFTAMNSDGDFYTGNKKVNSATGKEEVFDSPIPTVTGEEIDIGGFSVGFDVISPLEISVTRSLKVEGGENKNLISEFDGPVVFTNKLTSTSDKGIEASSLYLQGDADVSRNITVGISTPILSGNYGDVVIKTEPFEGGNLGWVYTTENEWKKWGWVRGINDPLYGVGISSDNGPVGFSTLIDFVGYGIGVTVGFNENTNTSIVTISGDPDNTIGIYSGGSLIGDTNALNFIGEKDGFGFNINVDYGGISGVTTITFDVPLNIIDFKTTAESGLGYASPSFATTSIGTRIIYENSLNTDNTNYAVGIDADTSLWWSVPQNNAYAFKWFGGVTEIATLQASSGSGNLNIIGPNSKITTGRFISQVSTGTSPISVASSTLVTNLNANYLDGYISAATTTPNTIVRRDASNNINGNISHLRHSVSGAQRGEWYTDIPARLGYTPFNKAGDTCTGNANFEGLTTIKKVSDIFVSGAGPTLTCDFNSGPITRTTSTNVSVINITNVPQISGRAFNYTVVINAPSQVSDLSSIQFKMDNNPISVRWLNNIAPSGTNAGYYFFGFTIFRLESSWEVIGVFATYG